MRLRDLFRASPAPGTRWDGPAAYIDAAEAARLNMAPGHYALDTIGKTPLLLGRGRMVRLVAVDDAPGDAEDGAWHLEVAAVGDPIARPGRIVSLEFHGEGRAEVAP